MADQVQDNSWHGLWPSVPSPGVGAVRGAPRHQAEQRDARRVLQRQAGRFRPGAPRRPQPRRAHDDARRHHGLHGPGVRGDQPGQCRDRRLQLRRRPPRDRLKPEAHRPAGGGQRQRRPARAVGLGDVRERRAP